MQKARPFLLTPPVTVSPKLFRQVTEYEHLIGCPAADAKIRENNKINHVRPGDKGYLRLSYEILGR